jgi:hypothetical protein
MALRPRPVEGVREYALRLDVVAAEPKPLLERLEQALVAAGAEVEPRHEALEAVAVVPDGSPNPWAIQARTESTKRGAALAVRIRPRHLTYDHFWPPRRLRAPLLALVQEEMCYVGTARIEAKPKAIPVAEVPSWIDRTLFHPERTLPIVAVTPGPYAAPEALEALARDLAGLAQVVLLDVAGTHALSARVTKERSVYGGAVRIFRPGFGPQVDPLAHDLMVTHYLEERLAFGRTLAEEVARRILPFEGPPIALSEELEESLHAPLAGAIGAPDPVQARLAQAEAQVLRLRDDLAQALQEQQRLRDALHVAEERIGELEGLVPTLHLKELPWPLQNPKGWEVEVAPRFAHDAATVARDGSLAHEVRKKMEAVLLAPEEYGKDMRGERKGQRATYVARNYRLVWSVEGRVRFVLVVSKEDPEYSPFGA